MIKTFKFDLQLFADEGENSTPADNSSANDSEIVDNTSEDTQADTGYDTTDATNTNDDQSDYLDEISKAMGVTEETKREVLKANGLNPDDYLKEQVQEPEGKPPDTQPPRANDTPPNYEELYKQAQAEIESLKRNQTNTQTPTAAQQNINKQYNFQPAQVESLKITPEIMDAVNPLIMDKALQMSGLKKEDLDGLEYTEDGERKQQTFNNAMALARSQVMNDLNNRYIQMKQEQQQRLFERQESIKGIQDLVKQIESVPNHETVSQYITTNYISTLPVMEQTAIRQAYIRADRGESTYADNMILRSFWDNGLSAYNQSINNPAQNQSNNRRAAAINENMNRRNQMPRVNQVQSAGTGNPSAWTVDRLAKALQTEEGFNSIPEAIKNSIRKTGQI